MLATKRNDPPPRRPALLLALTAAVAASALAAAVPAAAEPSIAGLVRDEAGQPVAGARVKLFAPIAPWRQMAAELAGEPPEPVAATRTGDDGRYELAAPAGLWRLVVEAPGYRPERSEVAHFAVQEDAGDAAAGGHAVEQAPVELDADAGLALTVTDAAGRPLAGARAATAWGQRAYGGGAAAAAWREVAGADGRVRLPRLPQGRYEVAAAAPGWAVGVLEVDAGSDSAILRLEPGVAWTIEVRDRLRRPVPGAVIATEGGLPLAATGEDGRAEVRLPAAGEARLRVAADAGHAELVVKPPRERAPDEPPDTSSPLVVSLAPAGTLAGRVLAEPGRQPIAGARVWVGWRPDLATTTDARGAFVLPLDPAATPDGDRLIVAAAAAHQRRWERFERHVEEALLLLTPQAAIAGRVVDSAGEPVAGARLQAASQIGWTPSHFPAIGRAVSGADGRFHLPGLDPGATHRLRVDHPLHAPAELDVAAPAAGVTRSGVEVVLDPGTRAFGVVFGADGAPLAGATAELRPMRGSEPIFRPRPLLRDESRAPAATSDGEGRFAIEHVVPGRYDLWVAAAGHAPLRVPGVEVPAPPEAGDLGSVSLQPGAEVAGRVRDADGAAIAGAEVRGVYRDAFSWGGEDEPPTTKTGADGRFVLADLAPGQRLDLLVGAEGFVEETVVGVVAPPERPVEVELTRAATLAGRVVDGFGVGVPGARVHAEAEGSEGRGRLRPPRSRMAAVEEDGSFVLEGVPTGAVRVIAGAEDFQDPEPLRLELAAGERREGIRIELARGGALAGRVTGPDGQPIADATVQAAPGQRAMPGHQARTDAEGRYRIGGLPPGLVQVRAEHPDFVGPAREATIGAGETRLDLELRRGLEISGRVVDEAGAPVAGAEVMLTSDTWSGYRPPTRTGDDGAFRLRGVEPGTWRLMVTKDDLAQLEPDTRYEVADAPLVGIEVRMTAGAAIAGTVRGLDLADVARLRLFAMSEERKGMPRTGVVDFEGGYRIEGVGPGRWRVVAMLGEGEGMASGEAELAPGQPEARLDLDFAGDVTLTGRVTVGGEALAGAQIGVVGQEAPAYGSGRTGGDGRFEIGRLAPGLYELTVFAMDLGLVHRERVELAGDREVAIEIDTAEVSGRVVDADSGAPVAGAEVRLVPEDLGGLAHASPVRSEADGSFRVRRVPAGEHRLQVLKEGYGTVSRPLTVPPAVGVAGLEVEIAAAAGLVLEVATGTGFPPSQVSVAVLDEASAHPQPERLAIAATAGGQYTTGEGGRVRLADVPPGRWRVLVSAPGMAVTAVDAVAPGPPVPVPLAPEAIVDVVAGSGAGGAAAGLVRLLAADGRPLLVPGYGIGVQAGWPLSLGRVRLANVPAGAWTLEITGPDERVTTRPVTAVAGQIVEVVVE